MSMKVALQAKLIEARKAKNNLQLSLLQVILGDVSTLESRSGKPATDDEVERVIRKTAEANYTSLALIALGDGAEDEALKAAGRKIAAGDPELLAQIRAKNADALDRACSEDTFLVTLLPKTLSVEQIKEALVEAVDGIKAAKNDNAAMGVAMKTLKPKGLKVLGDDVVKAVKELRA